MSRMLSRRMTVLRNNFELELSGIYVDSDLRSRVKLPDILHRQDRLLAVLSGSWRISCDAVVYQVDKTHFKVI